MDTQYTPHMAMCACKYVVRIVYGLKNAKVQKLKWWPREYFEAESKNHHNKSFFTENTNNIPENIVISINLLIIQSIKVICYVVKCRENCENSL